MCRPEGCGCSLPGWDETEARRAGARPELGQVAVASAGGGGLSCLVLSATGGTGDSPGAPEVPVTLLSSSRRWFRVTLGAPSRFPAVPHKPAFLGGRGSGLRRGAPKAALPRQATPQSGWAGRAGVPGRAVGHSAGP